MPYSKVEPDIQLQPYVESIWIQENNADARYNDFTPTVVLPVPKIDFIFHYSDPFAEIADNKKTELPRNYICGIRTNPVYAAATGKTGLIIVSMYPWSTSAFLSCPINEFTNKSISFECLFGSSRANEFAAMLDDAGSNSKRVQIIQKFLINLIRKNSRQNLVQYIVSTMNQRNGNLHVHELAKEFKFSRRHLSRMFAKTTGLSPKEFSNMIRFQKALYLHKHGSEHSEIVHNLGYFDQSHFIREIKRYTGKSPGEINVMPSSSRLHKFFNNNYMSHFYNTVYL